jgi:hypothetical protein
MERHHALDALHIVVRAEGAIHQRPHPPHAVGRLGSDDDADLCRDDAILRARIVGWASHTLLTEMIQSRESCALA